MKKMFSLSLCFSLLCSCYLLRINNITLHSYYSSIQTYKRQCKRKELAIFEYIVTINCISICCHHLCPLQHHHHHHHHRIFVVVAAYIYNYVSWGFSSCSSVFVSVIMPASHCVLDTHTHTHTHMQCDINKKRRRK